MVCSLLHDQLQQHQTPQVSLPCTMYLEREDNESIDQIDQF